MSPSPDPSPRGIAPNAYGHFSPDGTEYVVTDPSTPRPWVNVIANPRSGLVVSQTGSGFSWVDNSQLGTVTRWQQDLVSDSSGKFLWLVDREDGEAWSLSPAPSWPRFDRFACRHGLGLTTFETEAHGVAATWTLFADPLETVEGWRVTLRDTSRRPRRLFLVAYLEWNMGVSPSPRREFTRLFLETWKDPARGAVLARSHMWEVGSARYGHWNTSFPYVSALASTLPVDAAEGDKLAFLGRYRDPRRPAAFEAREWKGEFGRHGDAVAALRCPVELPPGGSREAGFVLATGGSGEEAAALVDRFANVAALDASLAAARAGWKERLAAHRVATPEPTLDLLVNDWARYQAISARLWGRCGYYQQSGAFGFRDQLQDSQVWLTIDPALCREQVGLHARHQFGDGSVYHWWHPLTEQGHVTRMTDDLLWLGFVTASYVRETGDLSILDDPAPYLDEEVPAALEDHVLRAFRRVFARTSPRGLPHLGAGDWNDGLSAAGLEEKGESVWLGHFLASLLSDWAEIWGRRGNASLAAELRQRREALVAAINEHAWDGEWYWRATLDDGSKIGSAGCDAGRIYLNAQTWAILADVAPEERAASCHEAVKRHLVSEAGALLLAPAYETPVPEIGYITRYAPGLRENGGVYSHAATWAIAAAAKRKDAGLVEKLLLAIDPARKDADRYAAEPYVLPGNVDGPLSPHHGRAGWTWYTGSAQWLHRIVAEWVLGVRPEWDGLRLDPCLPPSWPSARMTRPWRGATFDVTVERSRHVPHGRDVGVFLDGVLLAENLVTASEATGRRTLRVLVR